jgi:phosphatidylglycerophosphate synthase
MLRIVVPVIGRDGLRVDLVRRGLGLAGLGRAAVVAALLASGTVQPVGAAAGLGYGLVCDLLIATCLTADGRRHVGAANAVTWTRCVLVGAVVALVTGPAGPGATGVLVVTAAVALLLDGVDGRIARATHSVSAFGSRFDMEVDASLVLALSIAAAVEVGPWILLVGAARYLLLLATALIPRLAAPTAPRLWRKAVAVLQGVALIVVCAGSFGWVVSEVVAVLAASALAVSFGTQIRGLLGTSTRTAAVKGAVVDAPVV